MAQTQLARQASGLAIYREGTWGVPLTRVGQNATYGTGGSYAGANGAGRLRGFWDKSEAFVAGDVVQVFAKGALYNMIATGTIATNTATAPVSVTASGGLLTPTAGTNWTFHQGALYPVTELNGQPMFETIIEQGFRGQGSRDLNALQGGASGDMSFTGWLYPDILGNLLRPVFGTVTSRTEDYTATGKPFENAIVLAPGDLVANNIYKDVATDNARYFRCKRVFTYVDNDEDDPTKPLELVSAPTEHTYQRGDVPLSSTIYEAVGGGEDESLIYRGARCGSADLNFDGNSGVLMAATTWMGQEPRVTSFPPLFSSAAAAGGDDPGPAFVGWQGVFETDMPTGTELENRTVSAEMKIERDLSGVWTARNNRSPYSINVGPIGITGKYMVVLENFSGQYEEWRAFLERQTRLVFSSNRFAAPGAAPDVRDPFPERRFELSLNRNNIGTGAFEVDRGEIGVIIGLEFTGLHNSAVDNGPGTIRTTGIQSVI